MKERILKLCKRLDKFSLDDISTIADDINESTISLVLMYLVHEGQLIKRDNIYFYNKKNRKIEQMPFIKYFPMQIIDLTMKAFCSEISAEKITNLLPICEDSTMKIYSHFRESIYNDQYKKLYSYYNLSPQKYRSGTFFNSYTAYFYTYNNLVFITNKPFFNTSEKNFSKSEIKEFKKIYSYLSRIESHNKNKINIYHKLAEALWKRNKSFDELYESLKNIMNM